MTYRNLLLLGFLLCFSLSSSLDTVAQCSPDPAYEIYDLGVFPFPYNEDPDNPMFPDSSYVGITDTIYTGEEWSMTFTAIVPPEIVIDGNPPVALEYVKVTQVNGLPPGLNYECSISDCVYPAGTHCFIVSGTTWIAGTYDVTVDIVAKAVNLPELPFMIPPNPNYNGLGFPLGTYTANVVSLTNISEVELGDGSISAYPNPFSEEVNFSFELVKNSDVILQVSDLSGKTVYSESMQANSGINFKSLLTTDWSSGLYIYEITDGATSIQGKLIKD